MAKYSIFLNPLRMLDIDLQPIEAPQVSSESVLAYLTSPNVANSIEAFVQRYRDVSSTETQLHFAPAEPEILEKLVWPLRSAKCCYSLGDYLGCIAMCGMVGEMLAILIWDMSTVKVQDKPVDASLEKALFGRAFEKLGQADRTRILFCFGLIGDDSSSDFDKLRTIRRKYLHLFSLKHDRVSIDSREIFETTLRLVTSVLGQEVVDGKINLSDDLQTYLATKGVVGTDDGSDDA